MRRHPFDPISAVSGAIFLAAGVIALTGTRNLSLLQAGRLWAVLLLIGGVAVLVAALRRAGSDSQTVPVPAAPERLLHAPDAPQPPNDRHPITEVELAIQELAAERQAARDQTAADLTADDFTGEDVAAEDPPGSSADSQDE